MAEAETALVADHAPEDPEVSLVVPCYNEEACLEDTMPPLAAAFAEAGIGLQLVLVDNGSCDSTPEVIDRLAAHGLPITAGKVPVNQGQGLGYLTGFDLSRGRYIGFTCADGQVNPSDVVAVCRAVMGAEVPALGKIRRRSRGSQDGWLRNVVSIGFNSLMHIVFPGLPSFDINGNPKVMPAHILRLMELSSRDWFVEAEVVLKAWHLRLRVIEVDIRGKPRTAGRSHVRVATAFEFVQNIAAYRFGGPWREWCKRVGPESVRAGLAEVP